MFGPSTVSHDESGIATWTASRLVLSVCLVTVLLAWTGYTVYGLSLSYSYWLDEIFSVVASSSGIREQLDVYLNDVHPPLYQILLSLWVGGFGQAEWATRALSSIAVLAAMPAYWIIGRTLGREVGTLTALVVLCNWLVYVYALETRSYALVFSMSSWALALFASGHRSALRVVLCLLGLTHFFGTLLAACYLAWLLWEKRTSSSEWLHTVLAGVVIMAWPIGYVVFGNAEALAGGKFWIQSTPGDGIGQAIQVAVPGLVFAAKAGKVSMDRTASMVLVFGVTVAAAVFVWAMRTMHSDRSRRTVLGVSVVLCAAVAIASAINVHTPVTTPRNFMVIVPLASLLVAIVLNKLLAVANHAVVTAVVLGCVVGVSQAQIHDAMQRRFGPTEDYKTTARMVDDVVSTTGGQVYVIGSTSSRISSFRQAQASYYLHRSVVFTPLNKIGTLPSGSIVVFGHRTPTTRPGRDCYNDILGTLDSANRIYTAHFTTQTKRCENGFVRLQ